jgi:hypothetical protein
MKRNKRFLLTICLSILAFNTKAQNKTVAHEQQFWLAYFNQTRLSDKWGLWADFHLRTKEDLFTNFSTGIARLGLMYYINNNTKLSAGYAYVHNFPGDSHKNIARPEHRPWQQIQWHSNYPNIRLMQYLRLEERYRRKVLNNDELADGYNFNFRLRYNFFTQFPIGPRKFQPGSFSFIVNDELHINFGKEIVYNTFDQNRFFTGFQYQWGKHTHIQFGYMNQFVQLASGSSYRSIHAARVFVLQNLDLRKARG